MGLGERCVRPVRGSVSRVSASRARDPGSIPARPVTGPDPDQECGPKSSGPDNDQIRTSLKGHYVILGPHSFCNSE